MGYIVDSSKWNTPGEAEAGLRLVVQSERAPAYLEERVDAFLDEMKESLSGMTDSEFEEHKRGLEKYWLEEPKNIKEEASHYWMAIDTGYLDFLRRECNRWCGLIETLNLAGNSTRKRESPG